MMSESAPEPMRWPHASHVGTRAIVRYRLPEGERGPHGERLTDVIGRLLGFDEHEVRLLTRDGEQVTVARAAVVAAKPLPPALRRRSASRPAPRRGSTDDGDEARS